ncbi:hypothetical protein [Planctomicrobium sp. SH664]|uniref:hypothetical protein n=1 Tax=Planctomicrobium sp. SH664 TaxID=3448125 RepID=UPI003F5C3981
MSIPKHLRISRRRLRAVVALSLLCVFQTGCVQNFMMLAKVLSGDPIQQSALEQATGINLKKAEKKVLVYCSSPALVTDDYSSLTSDVQEELIRKMRRHKLIVSKSDDASRVLDSRGGKFDPKLLARELPDVDYIAHVRLEGFSCLEPASKTLYRGRCNGKVTVYEVRGEGDSRHTVQVMDQTFQTSYPSTYPIPVDQIPKNVFLRECIDQITDCLGNSFYSVNQHSLFAN